MASICEYALVAAIDFGTTYSGYGFSFEEGSDIRLNKNWSDHLGYPSYKAPTSVLLDEESNFKAFGYEAETQYLEYIGEDDIERAPDAKAPELFRNFKMALHNKEVTMKSTVCSVRGTIHPAIDIFSHALKYLKNHMIRLINEELPFALDENLILWVITVPAIWSEKSKQFMREAALMAQRHIFCFILAGLIADKHSKNLSIALEPEAASFYCRSIDFSKYTKKSTVSFPPETKYMVLDCGGGTNDMVIHEVVSDMKVKELCAVNGGANGGNKVNSMFEEILDDALGKDFIRSYQTKSPCEWLQLMSRFERAKKMVCNDADSKVRLDIPYHLHEEFSTFKPGKSVKESFASLGDKDILYRSGHLIISNAKVKELFEEVIANIIMAVQRVIENQCNSLEYIFMVGGFSQCTFLSEAIRTEFSSESYKVIAPYEAQLAILKGAVQYGFHRDQIISRIARCTYGANSTKSFNELIHDQKKHFVNEDGEERCANVFVPLVNVGQSVILGNRIEHTFFLTSKQTDGFISIFSLNRLPNELVDYTTNDDMVKLGDITVESPDLTGGNKRKLVLSFTFGETEIFVEAEDKTSGNKVETTVDFVAE